MKSTAKVFIRREFPVYCVISVSRCTRFSVELSLKFSRVKKKKNFVECGHLDIMYHHQLEQKSLECDRFVSRLMNWPVLASACGQVNGLYASTKERNQLLKKTLETAESGVGIIINTTTPVLSNFEKQINVVNSLACGQLDKIENSFPIVKKPTEEVVKATKDLCNSAVKPLVDRVSTAKQFGYDKVSGVRTYTGEKLNNVKNYGMTKAGALAKIGTDRVAGVMGTSFGNSVVHRVEEVIDKADCYVDSYLPQEESEGKADDKAVAGDVNPSSVVATKAYRLASKVRQRMYSRVLKQMSHVQLQTRQTLGKLNFTVDLIEYARSNFDETTKKVHSVWEEINKTEEEVLKEASGKESTHEKTSFEQKAITTARHLTTKLRNILSTLHSLRFSVGSYPQMLTGRIQSLQEKAVSLANIFSKETTDKTGLPKSALDTARNVAQQIYSGLFDMVSIVPGYQTLQKHLKFSVTDSDDSRTPSEKSTEEEEEESQCHSNKENEEESQCHSSKENEEESQCHSSKENE